MLRSRPLPGYTLAAFAGGGLGAFEGYTLLQTLPVHHLIDMRGRLVHSWDLNWAGSLQLPPYPLARVAAGQYDASGHLWEAVLAVGE